MNGSFRQEITQRINLLVLAGRIIDKHFRTSFPLGRINVLVGKTNREVVMVTQMVASKVYKTLDFRNYSLGQMA